jgi:hypothetical protein
MPSLAIDRDRAVEAGFVPPIYGLNPATTALTNRIEQYPMAR